MLLILGTAVEMARRLTAKAAYRIVLRLAMLAVFLFAWAELAFGIFD